MFSRPSQNPSRSKLLVEDLSEPPVCDESAFALDSVDKKSPGTSRSVGDHDWIAALLYVVRDTVCWVVLYGIVGYIRRDQFFVSPFEFVLVDCVVLDVILQALYIIGGFNRSNAKRGLVFMAEQIFFVGAEGAVRVLLVFFAAGVDA